MSLIERARELRATIEALSVNLDDAKAVENTELFPAWKVDTAYAVDERVRYQDTLYKVLQSHTSQADWTPDVAVSLFARVLNPDPDVIPDWEQPDSTNPYMKGDKVRHNDKVWESLIDNNVWEPGAVGTESLWTEVEE